MDANPLIPALLAALRRHPAGIKEYDLLAAVQDHAIFTSVSADTYLALFQKHFLLMNGLYQLQTQLWHEEKQVLMISPLNIQLAPAVQIEHVALPEDSATFALKTYYLDWDNFIKTAEDDVKQLLDDFWKRFVNIDAKQAAFKTLALTDTASPSQIRQRYRELAAENHPDKGGDTDAFIKIREAYEVLKSTVQ